MPLAKATRLLDKNCYKLKREDTRASHKWYYERNTEKVYRENPEKRKEASKQAYNKNSQQMKEAAKTGLQQKPGKQKRGL